MLQTINFSNEFDFKAIQEYIERIPQVKRLSNQSVKMTIFKEFATDIAAPVRSRNIQDGLTILHKEYHDSEMTLPKIVNINETENKLVITYMPFLGAPYKISLNIVKQKG